ncbi:MAG: hypothetical protein DWQ18_00745 [Crenarchaeota archaeon]|nr:MAG: hypothetical protein DWQ17_04470 [Thermoproteota archaeon]RDJ34502.1 MAG: hypothetical protein DWQ18_00745 [Thermoproteota archaeon]RDJ34842.1 MAG: hypothetical protein DWQ19_13860 [Thermoproteota archaeon]RDJ38555.1 MAG: hypothetical protein DWQ13_04075 [Thermoproteota archaeon]
MQRNPPSENKIGTDEIECEEAIMKDKQRFGRVRTSLMRHLRSEYGSITADRALSRINKRASNGSLRAKYHLKEFSLE